MRRRSFLKTMGAALCGALIGLVPDLAPPLVAEPDRFGIAGPNILVNGIREDFIKTYIARSEDIKASFDQALRAFENFTDTEGEMFHLAPTDVGEPREWSE